MILVLEVNWPFVSLCETPFLVSVLGYSLGKLGSAPTPESIGPLPTRVPSGRISNLCQDGVRWWILPVELIHLGILPDDEDEVIIYMVKRGWDLDYSHDWSRDVRI